MNINYALFEKNIALLKTYSPKLFNKLIPYHQISEERYQICATQTSLFTTKIRLSGKPQFLYSTVDPLRGLQQTLSQIKLEKFPNILFLGIGLGYPLHFIDPGSNLIQNIFVFEKDWKLFSLSLYCFDYTPFIASKKIHFFINCTKAHIFNQLNTHFQLDLSYGYSIIPHPTIYTNQAPYFNEIKKIASDLFTLKQDYYTTQMTRSKQMIENMITNFPRLANTIKISSLTNHYKELSAIIVGPGPSLTTELNSLKKASPSIFIIALDTALPILIDHKIVPDFILSVDYSKVNLRHFNNYLNAIQKTALVVDPSVHPELLTQFKGQLITYNPSPSIINWFEKYTGKWGNLKRGLTVAILGIEFVKKLGFNQLCLIGLDFAYNQTHAYAKGSKKKEVAIQIENQQFYKVTQTKTKQQKEKLISIKGNYLNVVPTDPGLKTFLFLFQKSLRQYKHPCTNGSYFGAKITGAQASTLKQFIASQTKKQKPSITEWATPLPLPSSNLLRTISKKKSQLTQIHTQAQSALSAIEALKQSLNAQHMQTINQLFESVKKPKAIFSMLESLMSAEMYILNRRYFLNQMTTIEDKIHFFETFFNGISTASQFLVGQFEKLQTHVKPLS